MKPNLIIKLPLILLLTTLLVPGTTVWSDMPVSDDSDHDDDAQATAPAPTSADASAQAPAATDTSAASSAPTMNPDQLNDLVAPIALYPDTLLSQILVASTYPLEVVQATQWIGQNPELKGSALTSAAAQQPWDPSVQALVVFPDVMKRLSQDVTWVTNLGNAFLANQGSVMDAVQRMRTKAEESGKLKTTPQEKVTATAQDGNRVIEIAPANPQVIYVPDYNPTWIWGASDYYPYPGWYYPPQPAFGYYDWGIGFGIGACFVGWSSWNNWGWHPGWYHHEVVVNNGFASRYNFNRNVIVNRTVVVNGVSRSQAVWQHNPDHRLGVAYGSRDVGTRFRPGRYGAPADGTAGAFHGGAAIGHPGAPMDRRPVNAAQVQSQLHASAVRAQSGAAQDHFGNRQISGGYSGRSAFGGYNQGSTARMHSTRGFSSLHGGGSVSHSMGGGVAHAGGGGGVSHGGGGGVSAGGGHGGGGGGGGGGHH